MPTLEPHNGYYLWNYVPSFAAAVIFLALFAVATLSHIWKLFKPRTKFCWPFVLGCIFEVIGYAGRAAAYNNTGRLMPYVIQSLFLLVAPAMFAASIYMTLGRIIRCVKGEHLSVIRITWTTKAFVLGDITSFLVQAGSSGLMFNSNTQKIGEYVVIVGLAIQVISFGLFFLTAVIFQIRMQRSPTVASLSVAAPWKQTLAMLYAVSALIFVRSIFRIVEYILGIGGYPMQHEWTLYIFDSVPMIFVTALFYLRHPSSIPPPISAFGASEEIQLASYQSKMGA